MHEQFFRDILKPSVFREINLVRKLGNNAAHGYSISRDESLIAIKNLFRFLSFISLYYAEKEPDIPGFDESHIPSGEKKDHGPAELQRLQDLLDRKNEESRIEREQLEARAREVEEVRRQLESQQREIKDRNTVRGQVHDTENEIPLLVSEQLTRKLYIDQSLKEAGWTNFRESYDIEYEVTGMLTR